MDKEYVMQIADTIRQQLLATTPMNVICSWGALHEQITFMGYTRVWQLLCSK